MGANGSTEFDEFGAASRTKYHSASALSQGGGKPGIPEGIPKVTDVTHNSAKLSWLSPLNSGRILAYQVECCSHKDRKWRVITNTCQGTCYHVRNLSPETRYIFRVRAENICGVSKPSHCSEEVRTRSVPMDYIEEKRTPKLVRRHSHYLKLDSGVSSLLNKAEDQTDISNDIAGIPFRRNSARSSLPTTFRTKRSSVTSVLPGAKRESMCMFKESKRSFDDSSVTEEEGLNLKRISTSSTEASSIFSSNSMTSIAEDEEMQILYGRQDCPMCSDNDDAYSTTNSHVTTSSQYSSSSSKSSHSSSSHCSHHAVQINSNSNFLNSSVPDDAKIDYCSNTEKNFVKSSRSTFSKTPGSPTGKTIFDICDNEIWKGRIEHPNNGNIPVGNQSNNNQGNRNTLDLRSIRHMLNSQDVMVKTLESCSLDNARRTHCPIKEIDEDGIAMDIVSTI